MKKAPLSGMKLWRKRLGLSALLIGTLIGASSCQLAQSLHIRGASATNTVLDSFRGADHVGFTLSKVTPALSSERGRPVTTVTGKQAMSLHDCRAVALQKNLEIQVARMDEAGKAALEESARKKILPTLVYSSELSERDNQRMAYSDVVGKEGVEPNAAAAQQGGVASYSFGHERSTWRQSVEAKWSPTDAALAYYLTRNSANDKLKAHYQKVKAAQDIVGKVDAAYFRLLSLQEAMPLAKRLVAIRAAVEKNMRDLQGKQLKEMADYHRVNEKYIQAQQQLVSVQAEMERQRNELATALGISPDQCVDGGFFVVGDLMKPGFCGKICDLELMAVRSRPEAFQAGLDNLNSVNDLKRTIVKYFPRMTGFYRWSWDKDKYIFEKNWKEVGFLVFFDLVQWLSNNDERKSLTATVAKTEREMASIALGITSQVRVAALKYYEALENLVNSEKFLDSSRALLKTAEVKASRDVLDELALEEIKGDVVGQRVKTVRALGEANATLAELQRAMGTNYNEGAPCN